MIERGAPSAFCPSCGARRVGPGRCASCGGDEPPPRHVSDTREAAETGAGAAPEEALRRSTKARRAGFGLGAVAFLVIASVAVLTARAEHRSLDAERARGLRLEAANRALTSRLDSLKRQIASADVVAGQLSLRIGSIEANASSQPDPASLAKRAAPSVFTVEVDDGLGSGFVMRGRGDTADLVTNYHVVEGNWLARHLEVTIKQGDLSYTATIVKVNAADDLALLRAEVSLPALSAASTPVAIGDPVLVIGSPLGLGGSVATGIVSALRVEEGVHYIQFSAPISPGNSGGPILNAAGKVIGVSVAKAVAPGAEGLSFAIPVAEVCRDFAVC